MRLFSKHCELLASLLLVFSLTGLAQEIANADQAQTGILPPELLVKGLQAGGLVIYFRHAKTDRNQVDRDRNALNNCATQRNLSKVGRAQAQAIGEAARALKIQIGKVITSPFCRCKDTAQLAFGKAELSNDLRFGMGTDKQETLYLSQALKRMLATMPVKGKNTVLVSHTANLKEATGIWPEPEGAAYIFKPLPDNKFQYLGRLPPEAWTRLATQP